SLGMFVVDDRGPGYDVADGDPSSHKDTYFGIARLKRDLARQSSVGAIFTDREFAGSFNRVGGLDTQLNWTRTGLCLARRWLVQPATSTAPIRQVQLTRGTSNITTCTLITNCNTTTSAPI